MDMTMSDAQLALVSVAREIAVDFDARRSDLGTRLSAEAAEVLTGDLWRACCQADLLQILAVEDADGLGLGLLDLCLVLDELGRVAAPIPLASAALAAAVLSRSGVDSHRALAVESMSGKARVVIATHEALADEKAPATHARPLTDGWALSGSKVGVHHGMLADFAVVSASLPDSSPGMFLVALEELEGVRRAHHDITGDADASLTFSDTKLPSTALLDPVRMGPLDYWLAAESVAQCAAIAGLLDGATSLTAEYIQLREAFGRPISSFQAVGQRLGDAYIALLAARLTYQEAAWHLDEGTGQRHLAVPLAKSVCARSAQDVIRAVHHLHGGIGMDRDYPLHRFTVQAKWHELIGGSYGRNDQELADLLAQEDAL